MDQDEKGGMSSTHVILIILGALGLGVVICAGVIVVCLVAITALGTSANATFGTVGTRIDADSPQPDAMHFLNDLSRGDTVAAWTWTTAEFQQGHLVQGEPIKYFENLLRNHPGLRNPTTTHIQTQNIDPDQLQATITPKSGRKIILNLRLKKELGIWKVNDLAVVEEEKEEDDRKKNQAPRKDTGKD